MEIVTLFTLVTLGSLLTSLTGLGGGTLILAGLLLFYPPTIALPLHAFTQLSANALRAGIFFKTVKWKVVAAYACLMLPFAWLGASIFDHINASWLKIMIGVFMLISLVKWKGRSKEEPKMIVFVMAGALSGFVSIFVGAVGPMVTPLFNRLKISREGSINTKSAGQMTLQLMKIIAFSGATAINFSVLEDQIGTLVLGTLVGVLISIPIGKKISDEKFELAVNIMLGLIALKVLVEGIREISGY